MPACMDPGNFSRGDGVQVQIFHGGGGGPIARNLGFSRVEGPDLLPPTSGSAHGLYAFVSV